MGATVDRRGVQSVLDGYRMHAEKGAVMYSIWCMKELKFSFADADHEEGLQLLNDNLEAIYASGSTAMYQLRVYKEAGKDGMITNNTQYVGSFNFKVNDFDAIDARRNYQQNFLPQFVQQPAAPAMSAELEALMTEMKSIRDEMAEFRKGEGVGSPDNSLRGIGETVKSWLDIPVVQDVIYGIAEKWNLPIKQPHYESPHVAGMSGVEPVSEADAERLNGALYRLMAKDPELVAHLEGLADIAEQKPSLYNTALSFLK